DYVYRLGNLTLLTAKVNRDAADGSFMEKRRQALDKSALAINTNISRHSRWTDAEIHERQRDMAKLALEVWAL
ncbi:MAG: HNH endonuclease, partial [Verrucomicrobiales bacterium]|nr:HNH endonuclease [Verrucomicrobiales bacterium]